MMKRTAILAAIAFSLTLPMCLSAQDTPPPPPPPQPMGPPPPPMVQNPPTSRMTRNHGEAGVFADYFRFDPSGAPNATNYVGVGGRFGINVHPNLALEAEMSYDFSRNYTTTYSNGGVTSFVTTGVRPLTGLFGPKLQFGTSGPFRAFVTGKVGFVDFSYNNSNVVAGGTFTSAVDGVGGSGTHVAFYPGGGVEMFAGLIGLRLEAGDEIYLNSGTYNNLKVDAGPVFRF